jgi:hypothetical protein
VVLLGIAAAATALWLPEVLRVGEWTVMTDELQTVEQALTLWDGRPGDIDRYEVRSTTLGYAALLAPLYGLLPTTAAFTVAHTLNLLLMVSAAAPACLLANRLVASRLTAYLVAALTVAVPWVAQATNLLAEPLAYPIFVWTVLAIVTAVERGGVRADLVALVAAGAAFFVEPQLGVLGVVLVAAAVAQELRFPDGGAQTRGFGQRAKATLRGLLRRHGLLVAVGLIGLAAIASGRLGSALGSYSVTVSGDLVPDGFRPVLYLTIDRIAAGIAFLPLVLGAAWVAGSLVKPADRRTHAAALVLGLAVVGLLVVVTSFGLRFAPDPQERYVFYVAPLLFVATACFFRRPSIGWPAAAVAGVAGLGAAWILGQTTYGAPGILFASPATAFHQVLAGRTIQVGSWFGFDSLAAADVIVPLSVAALALAAVAVRARRGRTAFAVLGVALLVYGVLATSDVLDKVVAVHDERVRAVLGDRDAADRRWVDRAVPDSASVAVAPSASGLLGDVEIFRPDFDQTIWWDLRFWNASIDQVLSLRGNSTYTPFPSEELRLDERTGKLSGPRDPATWMVTSENAVDFEPYGRSAESEGLAVLWQLGPGFRAAWASFDIAQDGWTGDGTASGEEGTIRLYRGDAAERRRVSVTASANDRGRVPLRLTGGEQPIRGVAVTEEARTFSTEVCVPADGSAEVDVRARPGKLADGRTVGVRVLDVSVQTLGRGCG